MQMFIVGDHFIQSETLYNECIQHIKYECLS